MSFFKNVLQKRFGAHENVYWQVLAIMFITHLQCCLLYALGGGEGGWIEAFDEKDGFAVGVAPTPDSFITRYFRTYRCAFRGLKGRYDIDMITAHGRARPCPVDACSY
jgi:hypothetical protein